MKNWNYVRIAAIEKQKIALLQNQKKHLEAIGLLEETVNVLEAKLNKPKITTPAETQTEEIDFMRCEDCDYPAQDICDLGAHIFQFHVSKDLEEPTKCVHDFNNHTHSSDDMESEENSLCYCRFCDKSFETLAEVMKHNKLTHTNNVQHCSNFLENICLYGDNCWFLHIESERISEPSFKCKFCEKKFKTNNSLREHTKTSHIQLVAKCKNENECKFDPRKCWFVHKQDIEMAYFNAKNEGQNKIHQS